MQINYHQLFNQKYDKLGYDIYLNLFCSYKANNKKLNSCYSNFKNLNPHLSKVTILNYYTIKL